MDMRTTGRPHRFLFVEDEAQDVELEERQLRREGLRFEVRTAASEQELRRALYEFRPDLVLCDYSIPGFSGRQALAMVKEITPATPLIFVSGTIGEETAVECLREGATDYVLKGSPRRLGEAVRRALAEAEARAREREVESARSRLAEILEATPDFVAISDPDGRLTFINEAGCRLLGMTREEALSRPPETFYAPSARDHLRTTAILCVRETGLWQGETTMLAADGTEIPVAQVMLAHRDAQGRARFFSTIARDIRDQKAYEARIRYLANFDALTGLPNRTLLLDRLAQALIHARRTGRRIALVSINIDGFRLVNEGLGHGTGDALLQEFARRVQAGVREGDSVARTGGDEFAALLGDLERADDVHALARRLLDALRRPFEVGGRSLRLTASAGAAVFPDDGEDAPRLLGNAGAAMHRAKSVERGGFQFASADIMRESLERILIENGLGLAMSRGELRLHYQAQMDLRSGRLCGMEALMRWHRETGPNIAPAAFIPVAEESGLIRAMGQWALEQACATAVDWVRGSDGALVLGVNVSPLQLQDARFAESIATVLRTTGFPASGLELEMTESTLMSCDDGAIELLRGLKSMGLQISVDDFGTGYSSLSYLSRLPIDRLKIDSGFVQRMTSDSRDAAIVHAIISLGRGLGLKVIAEGVENEEQLEMLRSMDCDQAQGFLFSPVLAPERFGAYLSDPPGIVR